MHPVERSAKAIIVEIIKLHWLIKQNGEVESLKRLPHPVQGTPLYQDVDNQCNGTCAWRDLPLLLIPLNKVIDTLFNSQLPTNASDKPTRPGMDGRRIQFVTQHASPNSCFQITSRANAILLLLIYKNICLS